MILTAPEHSGGPAMKKLFSENRTNESSPQGGEGRSPGQNRPLPESDTQGETSCWAPPATGCPSSLRPCSGMGRSLMSSARPGELQASITISQKQEHNPAPRKHCPVLAGLFTLPFRNQDPWGTERSCHDTENRL